MPRSNSVITFSSAAVFDKRFLEYAFMRKSFAIDNHYLEKFDLLDADKTTQRNKLQMLEYFNLINYNNSTKKFKITAEGVTLHKSNYDFRVLSYILLDVTLPYTPRARHTLINRKYKIFDVIFKIFVKLKKSNHNIYSKDFEIVFCDYLTDENCEDDQILFELIKKVNKTNNFEKSRATIDYIFSSFANFGILNKKSSGCYTLSDDFFNSYIESFKEEGIELFREEEIFEDQKYTEGKKATVTINRYERNPKIRKRCIEYHGYKCKICGFDFEKQYGIIGKNFIEVHHITEISSYEGKETEVDPIKDMVPLCSNCHAMVHRKRPAYSMDEIMDVINKYKEKYDLE